MTLARQSEAIPVSAQAKAAFDKAAVLVKNDLNAVSSVTTTSVQ